MVAFNDRRSGSFTVTTHGYAEQDKWAGMPVSEARPEVHEYYRSQYPDSPAWKEANRLAKRRTDHQARQWSKDQPTTVSGAEYAHHYQDHLVRVMAIKGPSIMEKTGDKWDSVRDRTDLRP